MIYKAEPPKYRMVTWNIPVPVYDRLMTRHRQVCDELGTAPTLIVDQSEEGFGLALLELALRVLDEEEAAAAKREQRIVTPDMVAPRVI